MSINAVFQAAREIERLNRMITHLPAPVPLRIKARAPRTRFGRWLRRRGWTAASYRLDICHLTERHVAELSAIGNTFMVGGNATWRDVGAFLWRLHPLFIRPDTGELANRTYGAEHHYAGPWMRFEAWRDRRRLTRTLGKLDLADAIRCIVEYIDTTAQDAPVAADDDKPAPACAPLDAFDGLVSFCIRTFRTTPLAVLDHPRALIFQLFRSHRLAQPDGELEVMDPSDRYLDHETAAKEAHLVFTKLNSHPARR